MDFYQQMQSLRDGIAPLATVFGHPQARALVVRHFYIPSGSTIPSAEYLEINPHPIVTTVSPSTISAFQGISDVTIEKDDFEVKGISRVYGEIVELGRNGTGYSYFVDGVLDSGKTTIISGIECDFVGITLSSTLTWDMVIRRRPNE